MLSNLNDNTYQISFLETADKVQATVAPQRFKNKIHLQGTKTLHQFSWTVVYVVVLISTIFNKLEV